MLLRAPIAAPASALIEIYHLGNVSELREQWLEPRVIAAALSAMEQQQGWDLAQSSTVRPQRFAINVKEETHVAAANSHDFNSLRLSEHSRKAGALEIAIEHLYSPRSGFRAKFWPSTQ